MMRSRSHDFLGQATHDTIRASGPRYNNTYVSPPNTYVSPPNRHA
jgi:hypothetical protein